METTTKICTKCKIEKQLTEFNKNKRLKDGHSYYCKKCKSVSDKKSHAKNRHKRLINQKEYQRTKKGLCYQIFLIQKNKSKQRCHKPPKYTKEELYEWIANQENFEELYDNWVKSNYKKDLRPSIDRLDDYKGYSFDNIRLVTWAVNNQKGHDDKKNGINNKQNKAVLKYSLDDEFLGEYHSIRSVARILDVSHSGIMRCCQGKQKYAHGFKWKYKEATLVF